MDQLNLKKAAVAVLQECPTAEKTLKLPLEGVETEVMDLVVAELEKAGGRYRKSAKTFYFDNGAPSTIVQDVIDKMNEDIGAEEVLNGLGTDAQADATAHEEGGNSEGADGQGEDEDEEEDFGDEPDAGDQEPEEEKKPQTHKERRTLQYHFTASEIHDFAIQAAHKNKEVGELENEKGRIAQQYASKIKEAKATLDKLSNLVAEGYEFREVEVEIFFHQPEPGKKTVVRQDTGTAKVEKMETWEYNLFNQPKDEEEVEDFAETTR